LERKKTSNIDVDSGSGDDTPVQRKENNKIIII
jgi:hypothetical protein